MPDAAEPAHFELRSGPSWRAPWDDYRRLRDAGPIHLAEGPAGTADFYVLCCFAEVFDAVRDTETFSSAEGLTPSSNEKDLFEGQAAPIVMLDPPDHTAMRRLVSRPLTPRRVAQFESAVTDFVVERIDRLIERGEGDIIEALFKPLPSFVVAHYLGVPESERSHFDRWTAAIVSANAEGSVADAGGPTMELFAYADDLIARRRAKPGDDLVSDLVAVGESVASPAWIIGFVFTMVTGGNDTMTGLLGGAAELLTRHRDQRQILLDDPDGIGRALEEFLRLTSPVQNLARTATRDVAIADTEIEAGTKVLLLYGSANLDEREFGPTASTLDVRREISRMLSFGYGPHHCLGAAAARLQGRVALGELLSRCPEFEVDLDAAVFAPGSFVRRHERLPFRAA